MKIALVYYSRTGNTESVVNVLRKALTELGFQADVYRVRPVKEYSKPLHVNPRLLRDTIIRKGTDIYYEPEEPKLMGYDVVIAASPVWCFTLAPPIQEFLKRHRSEKPLIIVTTSMLEVNSEKVEEIVRELYGSKPLTSLNIKVSALRDIEKLKQCIDRVVKFIAEMKGKSVHAGTGRLTE